MGSSSEMSPSSALRDGARRVNAAPAVLAGMFLLTLLVALPLSIALRGMLEAHLGPSVAAESAAAGVNHDWWQEFAAQATALGTTFVPSIIGFGAVLENLSSLLDNAPLASTIAGITAAWLVLWSFLTGGVLDRYARGRPTRAHGFFAACGMHFWRFVRLGIIALALYSLLFGVIHPAIFETLYPGWVREFTVERNAFLVRVACYVVFGALLVLTNLIFDYARIRTVVEDRRSAVGSLAAGARFVRRRIGATLALYVLNGAAFLLLVLLYALLSPGAPGSGWRMWLVFVLGELYILGRHYLKLLFYASEVALFQSALAHATYTAAPAVVWPDSPAAESIANADPSGIG
jgi:hypothetical protein